ncbi:MAG: DUF58 domain-containing protein [Thermodesulfobacteriota bacterium]
METAESRLPSLFIIPLVQFLVGILLFIALLHGQRDLTVLALLILGITIGARLWSKLSISRIRCSALVDKDRLFPDEPLALQVSGENAKFLPVWLQIGVPVENALEPAFGEKGFTGECGLFWYQKARFDWKLIARRRGLHRVGPVQVKVGDLLGFFPRERRSGNEIQVLVYPKIVPFRPFSLPRRDFFGTPGARSPVQDPVYILGTRDYQHWRPARHIHWKASARQNRLQEKLFEPSEQEKVLLAIEVSQFERSNASENFERTLEVVGSLAVQSHQQGYAVGLVTNGIVEGGPPVLPIARSPHQAMSILEILARLKMKASGSLTDALHRTSTLPWGLSCVHFSHRTDQDTRDAAQYFFHKRVPTILVVCSSAEIGEQDRPIPAVTVYRMDEIRMEETQRG